MRGRYYLTKIAHAWQDGTLSGRVRRWLAGSYRSNVGVLADYASLSSEDRRRSMADAFPDPYTGAPDEQCVIERVVRAYRAAKRDEADAPERYQIRGLWAEWISVNYGPLLKAIDSGSRGSLTRQLQNFARAPFAIGTGACFEDLRRSRPYVTAVWCKYRDILRSIDFDLSTLAHPPVGNPAGFRVTADGPVIPTETLRHAYHGALMVDLLRDVRTPVVLEIGGGFGGQAFQAVHQLRASGNPVSRYYDFDIPEVGLVASYFLLRAFPDPCVKLYGEDGDNFAVAVLPHFAIDAVLDDSVDLVFNAHSFAEMDERSSRHYLSVVERACRRYFFHVNHDVRLPIGGSRNALGSELVPDPSRFKRIYKRPRVFGRPEDTPYPSFAYLYERMAPQRTLGTSGA
jgi:putative sugar O-methyltransferase